MARRAIPMWRAFASCTCLVASACASSDPTGVVPPEPPPGATSTSTTSVSGSGASTSTISTATISTATTSPATTSPATSPATTSPATTSEPLIGSVVSVPAGRPWRVLVVGDSVAASLAGDPPRELVSVADAVDVDVLNVGSVACPLIFDGGWWFSDGSTLPPNPVCDRPDRYDDEIATFAPDVVFALFGWPGAGGGQRFSDGTVATPCEARFDAAWEDGYRDLIERLAPHTLVVVATVAPISMDARRPETRCLDDIVRRLPAVVFDLQDWLCPELDCSGRAELRTDGVHFADEPALRRTALLGIMDEVIRLVGGTAMSQR